MMTIAEVLSAGSYVDILLDKHLQELGADYLKKILSERFDLDLQKSDFITAPLGKNSSAVLRMLFLKKYDVLFYLTDGSIFYPTAKKNILHIQSPLTSEENSLRRKIKLSGWDLIIYNSKFTKDHSEKNWPIKSQIIYPPVDVDRIKPIEKKQYILSVGRFFGYLKSKKHEILIKIFRDLCKEGEIKEWSLHLAGSVSEGDRSYLGELKKLAEGLPVFFYPNIERGKLIKLYGESAIYWHAAGYGEDEPAKMEHFGISTVEAMMGGCVPVVINKGGQTEIIQDGKNGLLWSSPADLMKLTVMLISDQTLMKKLSKNCVISSQRFSKDKFEKEILKLI